MSISGAQQLLVMDWQHFSTFTDNDPAQEIELIDLFITYGTETLQGIVNAYHVGDNEEWRSLCHKLKGSAANLGAQILAQACDDGEMRFDIPLDEKKVILVAIAESYQAAVSVLRDHMKGAK